MKGLGNKEVLFLKGIQATSAYPMRVKSLGWSSPGAWIADKRKGTYDPESKVSLSIGTEELDLLESGEPCYSENVYHNGLFYFIEVRKCRIDDKCTLGVYIAVRSKQMVHFCGVVSLNNGIKAWGDGFIR